MIWRPSAGLLQRCFEIFECLPRSLFEIPGQGLAVGVDKAAAARDNNHFPAVHDNGRRRREGCG